jgi:hypothetical protein
MQIATAAIRPVEPLSHIPSTTAANRTENRADRPTTSCGTPSGSRTIVFWLRTEDVWLVAGMLFTRAGYVPRVRAAKLAILIGRQKLEAKKLAQVVNRESRSGRFFIVRLDGVGNV